MCRKFSYQLINHTQQENDNSKKKFNDCYPKYKTRPGYEQTLQYWITNYGGIEEDNKCVAQYFKDLLIDTHNDYTPEPKLFYIESKQFYTFFGQLEGSMFLTVVNILANNIFKHQIILSNETVFSITLALDKPIYLPTHNRIILNCGNYSLIQISQLDKYIRSIN